MIFRSPLLIATSAIAIAAAAVAVFATQDSGQAEYNNAKIGKVDFRTSCSSTAQDQFSTGLVMLHHMMYVQAASEFQAAAKSDPNCAMAQWGIAMSQFHPLWSPPNDQEAATGQAAVDKLKTMDHGTDIEAAFITAMLGFYQDDTQLFADRLATWGKAQEVLLTAYPDAKDAQAIASLAEIATAPHGAASVPILTKAGERMDKLRALDPLHPGSYHYAIHAYDYPSLAEKGLTVSRNYLKLAPEVPHALHMPSHIFTRLGFWQESIDVNLRSANAVLDHCAPGEQVSGHYPHAVDYEVYAHLQLNDVKGAQARLDQMNSLPDIEDSFGMAYSDAAGPARVALEQSDWAAAAKLTDKMHPSVTPASYPEAMAIRWFAIGIGAARSSNPDRANAALDELVKLGKAMQAKGGDDYWITLLDAQMDAIKAWMALDNGDTATATSLMSKAADLEDNVGKAPVTPGPVLPKRELYGDMLRQIGDKQGAITAYETSLKTSPKRRRSVLGLAAAKEM